MSRNQKTRHSDSSPMRIRKLAHAIASSFRGVVTSARALARPGGKRMSGIIIVIAILAVTAIALVAIYNSLVQLKVRADNAWADIDVQLKRRHDLVPNLVETVKGYAAHEKGTFEDVARYRSAAMAATSATDRAQAEGQLTQALRGLLAVAEAYPELKANTQFQALQQSLSELEETLQNSRRYYNAVVRDLNTKIQSFPSNLIAGMFNFQQRQFFEIADPTERAVPSVMLSVPLTQPLTTQPLPFAPPNPSRLRWGLWLAALLLLASPLFAR